VVVEKNINIATVKINNLVSLRGMKRVKSISLVLLILFSITACFKNAPLESDIVRYSNISDIFNPPDVFELIYSLNTYNDYLALIEFETDAVWEIERISASGFDNKVWIERNEGEDNPQIEVINAQTAIYRIGFEGGVLYNFWASRSSGDDDIILLLLRFTKLDIDYETFSDKI